MSERTSGLYKLVTIPAVYALFQDVLGAQAARTKFRSLYFDDLSECSVLEVGCGPGVWVPTFTPCKSYLGLDWNKNHISQATKLYGTGTVLFKSEDISNQDALPQATYDRVFAIGLLHHLSDEEAKTLLANVARVLSPEGRFFAIEPVYHPRQNIIARIMKNLDSGQHIRTEGAYLELAQQALGRVTTHMHTDILRVPYSHCVIEGRL